MTGFYARISLFITGLVLGVILAIFLKHYSVIPANRRLQIPQHNVPTKQDFTTHLNLYKNWFSNFGLERKRMSWDKLRYTNASFQTESEFLFGKIKLLCIILVKKASNLEAANSTWAKGCNSIKPILLEPRSKIMPSKQEKEKSSWVMLCNALNNINVTSFSWILILRDTSFVFTENFRYFVAPLDVEKEYYLGYPVKFWGTIYNSGDPGYALSARSLTNFQRYMQYGRCMENSYWNKEDFYLGKYLAQLNINPISTLDEEGLSTFHPYNWYRVFYPGKNNYATSVFPEKCCSRRSIAFQVIAGDNMYTFYYFFYKLQIFTSGANGNQPFKDPVPDDKTWKQFLREQNIHDNNISSKEYYKLWENLITDPNSFLHNLKNTQIFDYD